ncbi:HAMP domain-containing protein [Desulfonatronum zhilinae]|nr:HAMP domain-containing protein [Desulfonatronum zhilinae]
MSINSRLALTIGGVILVAALITILFVNARMKEHALREAQDKAQVILDSRLAVHTYFSHQLKPILFDFAATNAPELGEQFEPVWMSSSYAVREMEEYFKGLHDIPYYYKEAAIDARHPDNEADALEREFIKRLNRDDELDLLSEIRIFDGEPYFTVLQRGETMEATCLRCHSEPERAPRGMVEAYGSERSFHRTEDEVVSAVSIRIPLEAAYTSVNQLTLQLAIAFGTVLVGLFCVTVILNKRWIFNPLGYLRDKAQAIATDPAHLGEQIKPPKGTELVDLANTFNSMSKALQIERNELEDRVRRRTMELETSNAKLRREMAEREQAEEMIRLVNQQLRISNEDKDRLFSIIAHDLKSPLTGLMTSTQMLAEDIDVFSEQEVTRLASELHKNTNHMMALLDDLMQWARMGQGNMEFILEPSSMHELASISLNSTQGVADQKDISIIIDIPRDMTAMIDKPMINTVIRNLLFNAVKFTPRGGEILVTARQEGDVIQMAVKDSGIGINKEKLSNLFTISRDKRQLGTEGEKGTGLGLVICKQFIEKHGGRIWMESEPGQGTTVFFTLPKGRA